MWVALEWECAGVDVGSTRVGVQVWTWVALEWGCAGVDVGSTRGECAGVDVGSTRVGVCRCGRG